MALTQESRTSVSDILWIHQNLYTMGPDSWFLYRAWAWKGKWQAHGRVYLLHSPNWYCIERSVQPKKVGNYRSCGRVTQLRTLAGITSTLFPKLCNSVSFHRNPVHFKLLSLCQSPGWVAANEIFVCTEGTWVSNKLPSLTWQTEFSVFSPGYYVCSFPQL